MADVVAAILRRSVVVSYKSIKLIKEIGTSIFFLSVTHVRSVVQPDRLWNRLLTLDVGTILFWVRR